MKRCAILLVLLSVVCLVSELSATVTTRHYDFEQGAAGEDARELIDITDALLHENADDFFGWGRHIWIEVSGIETRPLPDGSLDDVVVDTALVAPSLELNGGQGLYVDVSDGSEFDSPAIGSQLAIRFDGETFYDDSFTGAGSRGVYVNPTAFEAGEDVAGNVSESFNLMTQAWVYPELNNGEKQTVWQAGTEQGSVNITEDGFWQFEDLGSVGVLNCPQADGLEVPYSCDEGQFPVAFNEWTHLGIYRGGNGAEVYLNGELVAGNIAPDPPNFFGSFANQITIGARDDGSNGFIGLIDDFKVQGEVSLGVHDMDFNAVPPVVGDFNGNGVLDAGDINDLTAQSASGENPAKYDLNADTLVNTADVTFWIEDLFNSWSGDANLDGEFNTGDLVQILAAGTFEVDAVAVWGSGDFNGDGRFKTDDLVAALAGGGFELGPRNAVAAVPEPASVVTLVSGLVLLARRRRR